ncbi:MAG: flagellar export protein FliJ [Planctomycetales bacterium]|nr:flagellar export protein FliJ [Planctomycetales bacterium]
MTQFQFRLQSVVRLRERERDKAAGALREALAAQQKLQTQVDELLREHAAQQPLQAAVIVGSIDPQRLIESQRYQMHLLQQVHQLRSQIQLIEAECDKRRQNLLKREQELAALEKLRDKQRAAWQAQQLNREQMALDQWAGFQYWNQGPGNEPISQQYQPHSEP